MSFPQHMTLEPSQHSGHRGNGTVPFFHASGPCQNPWMGLCITVPQRWPLQPQPLCLEPLPAILSCAWTLPKDPHLLP